MLLLVLCSRVAAVQRIIKTVVVADVVANHPRAARPRVHLSGEITSGYVSVTVNAVELAAARKMYVGPVCHCLPHKQ